jgi:hypothetical protein
LEYTFQASTPSKPDGTLTGVINYVIASTKPNTFFESVTVDSTCATGELCRTLLKGILEPDFDGDFLASIDSIDGQEATYIATRNDLTSLTISDGWGDEGSAVGLTTISNKFKLTTPVAQVPGPLPLMGTGIAFGFSRRLRRRVATSRNA